MMKELLGCAVPSKIINEMYQLIVQQARDPKFYRDFSVPDTVDGRFEMISLHVFLVLRRLRRSSEGASKLSQALFDYMFEDMDLSLREMGAGDLGVGKRVKIMSENFMGRLIKYSQSLENNNASLLAKALSRNLYRQDGMVNSDDEVTAFVLKLSLEIASLKMDYVMSEEFDMNDLVASCLKLDNE